MIATMSWRSFPSPDAYFSAAATAAPEEMPQSSPSSLASRRAISSASSLVTVTIPSRSLRSSTSGTKPAPMPWIGCGEGFPPESTGLAAGSTAIALNEGLRALITCATPVIVPPVPTPEMSASTFPSVSFQISSAVVRRCTSGLAGFLNCCGMNAFGILARSSFAFSIAPGMPFERSVSTSFAPNARSTARRSGLIDSGIVSTHSYPFTAATKASAIPVFPLVGSTITVSPGVMSPSRSAASIIESPIRSFTLAAGFWLSSLATICGRTPAATRFRRTSGVRPTSSQTLLAMFMRGLLLRPRILARRIGVIRQASEQRLEQHGRIAPGRELDPHAQALRRALEREVLGPDAEGPAPAAEADPARRAPPGRDPVLREGGALALLRLAARLGRVRAEDRTGGADLERRRARRLALRILDEEEASARVQAGDVAGEDAVEGVAARAQHGVEDLGLQRGDEEARGAAVARSGLAAQDAPAELGVVAAEALRPEAVREAAARELLRAPRRRVGGHRVHVAHEDLEAIGAQVARAELVRVASRLEHPHAGQRERERRLRIESGRGEPLRRHRHAVLAAGVAHVARRHAGGAGEVACHLLRRAQRLLDAQEGVRAAARRRVEGHLVDPELLRPHPDPHQMISARLRLAARPLAAAPRGLAARPSDTPGRATPRPARTNADGSARGRGGAARRGAPRSRSPCGGRTRSPGAARRARACARRGGPSRRSRPPRSRRRDRRRRRAPSAGSRGGAPAARRRARDRGARATRRSRGASPPAPRAGRSRDPPPARRPRRSRAPRPGRGSPRRGARGPPA